MASIPDEPLLDDEIAKYLAAQGLGNLFSAAVKPRDEFTIFVGEEPERQNKTITVSEIGGNPPINTFGENRSFSIRTRSQTYKEAKATAQRIHRALHYEQGILEPAILVALITADTNPVPLGRDDNRRYVFTQTFTAIVKTLQPLSP